MLWISGYPKSGTTWLKYIVVALLHRTNKPKKVERYAPNLTSYRPGITGDIFKVHFVNPPPGEKLYIIRHPVDVCVSGINYLALSRGTADVDAYVEEFIRKDGNVVRDYGRWQDHVRNWMGAPDCSYLKYEDLLANTRHNLEYIARVIGASQENVDYALAATSFVTMRKLEKKGVAGRKHNVPDVFYNPKNKGYRYGRMFMNRGAAGYAREVLREEQIVAICDHFADAILEAGYEAVY